MTNNHVKTSLMGNHKINKVRVEIYFAPEVIEAYASSDEISLINNLKPGEEYDLYPLEMHFKNIFEIVKSRVLEFQTYEIFFDNIEYELANCSRTKPSIPIPHLLTHFSIF